MAVREDWVKRNRLVPVAITVQSLETNHVVEYNITLDQPRLVWGIRFVLDSGAEGILTALVSSNGVVWQVATIEPGDILDWQDWSLYKTIPLPEPRQVASVRIRVERPDVPAELAFVEVLAQRDY